MDRNAEFSACLRRRFGLDGDAGQLGPLLEARSAATGLGADGYLERLGCGVGFEDEERILVDLITVNETYFFRHAAQLDLVVDELLPALEADRPPGSRLRLLSAGCSTGEEAYSIAMLLERRDPALLDRCEIVGIDLDRRVLERAGTGRYSTWALRATSEEVRRSCFTEVGREYEISPRLRERVRFEHGNLAADGEWCARTWDLVLCRNVFIYFSNEVIATVADRFRRCIPDDGRVVLGPSETLRGLHRGFILCQHRDGFSYRPRAPHDGPVEALGATDPAPPPREDLIPPPAPDDSGWFEGISAATERLRALESGRAAAAVPRVNRRRIAEFLSADRTADAARLLDDALAQQPEDGELRLLRLAVAAARGDPTIDAAAHREQVERHPSGEAWLLAGLCEESQGAFDRAEDCYRAAIALDPEAAMPYLYRGILARRRGDRELAVRSIRYARLRLVGEDPVRLMLFGGGFQLQTLLDLADDELRLSLEGGR